MSAPPSCSSPGGAEQAGEDAHRVWGALRAWGGYVLAHPADQARAALLVSLTALAATASPGRAIVWVCASTFEARSRSLSAKRWGAALAQPKLRVASFAASPRARQAEEPPCLVILEDLHAVRPAQARHWLRTRAGECGDAPVLLASHAALQHSELHDWFFRRLGMQEPWSSVRASERLGAPQIPASELRNRGCYSHREARLSRPRLLKVRLRAHHDCRVDDARTLPVPARRAVDLEAKVDALREQWARDLACGCNVLVTLSQGGRSVRSLVAVLSATWGADLVAELCGKRHEAEAVAFATGSKRFAVTTTARLQHCAVHCRPALRHYVLQPPRRAWQWWVVLSSCGERGPDPGFVEVVTTGRFEDKRALLLLNMGALQHAALHTGHGAKPAAPLVQELEFPAELMPYAQLCLFARALALRFPVAARQAGGAPGGAARRLDSPEGLCAYVSSRHLVSAGASFAAGFLSLCWQAADWLRPCVDPTYPRPGQDTDAFCRRFGHGGVGSLSQLPAEVLARCLVYLQGRPLEAAEVLAEAGSGLLDAKSLRSFLVRASRLALRHQQQLQLAIGDIRHAYARRTRDGCACQTAQEYVLPTRPTPTGTRARRLS
jgi:hypothetical protein